MKDLIQCSVAHDDFQRWLDTKTAPITLCDNNKPDMMLLSLKKNASLNYLYRTAIEWDNAISWDNSLMFCGVYDMERRTLYLAEDSLHTFMHSKLPLIAETGPSILESINSRINQRVEDIIANDRNNLPIQEITNYQHLNNLQYYQEYGAKEEAIQLFFANMEPDNRFHSRYALDELPETAFIAYRQDPEEFIQTEAEQYIKNQQEKFLLQFLKNEALMTEYQTLIQDTDNPIHRMKAITAAVIASGAKTVTVTVQKDKQELTFKTAASSLTGHKNFYSTYDIPASDRREFERLFGRYSDYNAGDITRITYGRNTIYEAPPVQTEEQSESMRMGGIQFG